MKKERCSWCGSNIMTGDGSKSNGKNYHNRCLVARNIAGKSHRTDYEVDNEALYKPVSVRIETQEANIALLTANRLSWQEYAKKSHLRIIAKYGNGMHR